MSTAEQTRQWRQANPAHVLWYQAQRRARVKGVPFTLTEDDMVRLLNSSGWSCVYCSTPVGTFTGRGARPFSATVDRLTPSLGYTPGNTVIACHRCNSTKAEHTPATLRAWADKLDALIQRLNPTRIQ